MFFKIGVLRNFTIFTARHLRWSLLSIKLQDFIKKETPTQVFPCEYCKIFKNTYFDLGDIIFDKYLWTAVSKKYQSKSL